MKVKSESEVTQLCPTLSDPMDCSLPGSSVHGVFQARVLEWGAIAFSESSHTITGKEPQYFVESLYSFTAPALLGGWSFRGCLNNVYSLEKFLIYSKGNFLINPISRIFFLVLNLVIKYSSFLSDHMPQFT